MDAQTAISEKLDTALNELTGVRGKFEALEMAVQHTFDQVEIVAAGALPSITNHIAQISRAQRTSPKVAAGHQRGRWSR